jgi:ABC-type multidrug transport system fused ATPase/permease subunit
MAIDWRKQLALLTQTLVVAIVGSSGAGKTSLVDVLLGAILPNEGSVTISGEAPADAIKQWPGAIAYVPQNVMVLEGTIRENIALGFPVSEATDELVMSAIVVAQLDQYVRSLPNGLDTYIEEKGTNLSGGQRQRIGIARAMFTKPKLLVLDEATSSLDGQTEAYISDAIQTLKGDVTVITIAHRLSTVKDADAVIYLDKGVIASVGNFDEVRRAVPNFDDQARLMGL